MSQIKISVPNDDSCALFHIGKSLIDLSSTIEGSPYWVVITQKEYDELKGPQINITKDETRAKADGTDPISQVVRAAQADTTTQQVELLAIPVEANGATYETDLGSDNPVPVCVADSTGTPWDERIHSASKALNSDGTWRVRRKPKDMDEAQWSEYLRKVADELLSDEHGPNEETVQLGNPEDPEAPLAEEWDGQGENVPEPARTEPPVTPTGDDFHVDAGEVTEQEVASIPAPPPPPVVAALEKGMERYGDAMSKLAENDGPVSYTFPQVMQFLTERHGRITSPQVDQIIADMGLNSIMDIRDNPEHAGPFIARVKALLGE